jgi:hypothetical protein
MWLGLIINLKLTSENDKTEKNDVLRLDHQPEADIRK